MAEQIAEQEKMKGLSAAQRRYLQTLVERLGEEERALAVAQEAKDKAQAVANSFVVYCAEELGVVMGREWQFDQTGMCFVRVEPPKPE